MSKKTHAQKKKRERKLTERQKKLLAEGRALFHRDGSKTIPMTPETRKMVEVQLAAFEAKFGRKPEPEDPLFFDPDADEPRPLREEVMDREFDAMIGNALRAGMLPVIAFAAWRTRRLVTETNSVMLRPSELQEWAQAMDEYEAQETEDARVFRVLMVEGATVTDPDGVNKMIALADELGVKDVVMKRIHESVLD